MLLFLSGLAWFFFHPLIDSTRQESVVSFATNENGFATMTLPEGIPLSQFTKKTVSSYFRSEATNQYQVAYKAPSEFFENLSVQTKKDYTRALALNKGELETPEDNLNQLLMSTSSILLRTDKHSLHLKSDEKDSLFPELKSSARGRLCVILLHKAGHGLFLEAPYARHSLYFSNINKRNLRYFGVIDKRQYDDKSYHQYHASFWEHYDLEVYYRAILLLGEGYSPALLEGLTAAQELILHDTAGIFIAEEYRLGVMKREETYNQILPGCLLLSVYLKSGGAAIESVSSEKPLRDLPRTFSYYNKVFPGYDALISSYLIKEHPWFSRCFKKRFGAKDGGLLQGLVDYMENPDTSNRHTRLLIKKLLVILSSEGKLIGADNSLPNE